MGRHFPIRQSQSPGMGCCDILIGSGMILNRLDSVKPTGTPGRNDGGV